MIDLSTALPIPKHPGRALRFAAPEASLFAVAMQTLQTGGEGAPQMPGAQPIVVPTLPALGHERMKSPDQKAVAAPNSTPPLLPVGRQAPAAGGKVLPEPAIPDLDAEASTESETIVAEDEAPEELDLLYAWFATAMAQPVPAPATIPPGGAAPTKRIIDDAPLQPSTGSLGSALTPPSPSPVESPLIPPVGDAPVQAPPESAPVVPLPAVVGELPDTIALPAADAKLPGLIVPAGERSPLPQGVRSPGPPTIVPQVALETYRPSDPVPAPMADPLVSAPRVERAPLQPVPATPAPQAPAPAPAAIPVEPFVAAAAPVESPAGVRRTSRHEPAPIALAGAGLTEPPRPTGVNPVAEVQHDAIDMRRQEWAGQMVERIEALREAASGGETRIRLAPDLLGTVDVAIRQEGDRVHVHFTAETAAARQLLNDAQPRLAELAEARGVRLGQTSVDGGATGQNAQGQRHDAAPGQPARPARASASDDTLPGDDRIA